ncbi:DUF2846 domain-containing protein [Chitinibacter sp. S2-10]|uniref:DUF2846 domain-containing protein n=1 Tax=Chitinibacter sp. S2-10 TaxID=3373597 RepID=UPI0039774DF5
MKKLFTLFLVAIALTGCASVPKGDTAQDAALKTFATKSDKAGLYLYRNEMIGAAVTMDVTLDGKPIGSTGAKSYLYQEIEPGKHTITSTAENTETLEIDAKAGALVYIWQEVKMGLLYARNKLHLVTEEEGQKGVKESSLVVMTKK